MTNLLPLIVVAGFSAVAAAALADKYRAADEGEDRELNGPLFRARREQFNAVGWRLILVARTLFLTALVLLAAQVVIAIRADQLAAR